jgi:hypothetical protein
MLDAGADVEFFDRCIDFRTDFCFTVVVVVCKVVILSICLNCNSFQAHLNHYSKNIMKTITSVQSFQSLKGTGFNKPETACSFFFKKAAPDYTSDNQSVSQVFLL